VRWQIRVHRVSFWRRTLTTTCAPLVSIGLPVFNGENFIHAALDSLLAQTYCRFELIISDNASTDATAEICQEYVAQDSRIRYLRQPINLGAAFNYNIVVEQARGKYFKWAAHDDLCAPTFLEQCVDVLENNPDVVVCYSHTILINEQGAINGYYADDLHLQASEPHRRYHQFFKTQGLCHPVFGLIRTSALKQTSLIGKFHSSDRVLLGELVLHGKFYELPDPLFLRRIHPLISTQANPSAADFTAWFDPRTRGKLIFPKWRRFVEYLKGIGRAPLTPSERIGCYLVLLHLSVFPERWFNLARDVVRAIRQLPSILFGQRARLWISDERRVNDE
jgi:glycosyltransferase involved in cell wall biosynthesis